MITDTDLYRTYESFAHAVARRMVPRTLHDYEAEDVAATALIRLLRVPQQHRNNPKYCKAVIRNESRRTLSHFRKHRADALKDEHTTASHEDSVTGNLFVSACLDHLGDDDRLLVCMALGIRREQLNHKQIGAILKVSDVTIRRRLKIVFASLRRMIEGCEDALSLKAVLCKTCSSTEIALVPLYESLPSRIPCLNCNRRTHYRPVDTVQPEYRT